MRRVIIESPFAPGTDTEIAYLRACLRDSLQRGEAPLASHGLYTLPGVLCDEIPEERRTGMAAGFVWHEVADLMAVYLDLGMSPGMREGIRRAEGLGLQVERRVLPHDTWDELQQRL